MDVRVDGECGKAEGLGHHDARGLVPDAGQGFELLERARDQAAVLRDENLGESAQGLGLGWSQTDLADELRDLRHGEECHLRGSRRALEEGRRDLVHLLVRRLSREHDRHEERERILVREGDRDLGMELVEDRVDASGLDRALHGQSIYPMHAGRSASAR